MNVNNITCNIIDHIYDKTNIGYAFVNLVDAADEDAFELAFNGFRFQG